MSENEFERIYPLSEIEHIRKEQKFKFDYTLTDAILFLLYSDPEPIKGKIRQMKEIFLTLYDVLPREKTQPVKFDKKLFGPYSKYVEDTIDHLIFTNLVSTVGKKMSKNVAIELAPKGRLYIQNKYKELPDDIKNLLKIKRKEWESHISSGVLGLVYRDHQDFLENAILKKRFKALDWKDTKQVSDSDKAEEDN